MLLLMKPKSFCAALLPIRDPNPPTGSQNGSNDQDVANPNGNNYAVARVHCSMNALFRLLGRLGRSVLPIVEYIIWKFETTQSPARGTCQESFEK